MDEREKKFNPLHTILKGARDLGSTMCHLLHGVRGLVQRQARPRFCSIIQKEDKDMKVCIAEKPSVAQDIARVIGATHRCEGYFEGNGYQVTWTFGHLCRLKSPEEYDDNWKRWSLSTLPMIPDSFGIRLIDGASIKKQFNVIKKLFAAADCIINCGDAGQEGELIQRWVMQLAKAKCPVKRLWISSLTEESIRNGFSQLKDQKLYDNLYKAGFSRASGDWLLGMNATRLYTLRYGSTGMVLSIGRVQTPTLALIVNRQKEIDSFKPEPYWQLTTLYRNAIFHAAVGDFTNKALGEQALAAIIGKPLVIDHVTQKRGSESHPLLYDLTSLQVECNKRFGFSAETTLSTIQSLYEKKLTTYPRVDTRYLSDDIYPKCQGILNEVLSTYQQYRNNICYPLARSKRVFDSTKVTDHHAIIPTGKTSHSLTEKEEKIYDLIARRFITVFCGDCTFLSTAVSAHVGNVQFRATGKEIKEWGWRIVYANMKDEDEKDGNKEKDTILPVFRKGESGSHTPKLTEKWTTAPKRYTEATLLQAMETAGKFVEDEELRAALKQNGIGRPSSRASIIETLFKRGYIIREKKAIVPTPTGMSLIDIIKSDLLKSCELTGMWEKKLRMIERGDYDAGTFISELKQQLAAIISEVKNDNSRKVVSSSKSSKHGATGNSKTSQSVGGFSSSSKKAANKTTTFPNPSRKRR